MATLKVILPQFLSHLVNERKEIDVAADTMKELQDFFQASYSAFSEKIWDVEGRVKRNVLFVLNDELINMDSPCIEFDSGDELSIILQFAGG